MVELPLTCDILLLFLCSPGTFKLFRVAEPSPFGLVCRCWASILESGQVGLTSEGACLTPSEVGEEEWEPPLSVARPGMFTLPETRDAEREPRSQEDVSFDLES